MPTGIDQLIAGEPAELVHRLRVSRLGLATNDLALTETLQRGREVLTRQGWRFDLLFGPEHGLAGRAREGLHISDTRDPVTGAPVRSLYGEAVRPTPDDLANLDVVLVDFPDVGARFYTYIWTLSHILEASADADVAVVVLDRPNPLGGLLDRVEGPMLDEACHSLVGRWAIPIRHSLTIGELARHWVRTRNIPVELIVVEATGWERAQTAIGRHELDWMPPSPNLPSAATVMLYPGTCFAEGVNLAEGRTTAVPFRTIAAPFLQADALAAHIRELDIPGIAVSPYGFTPLARDHAGTACEGILLHITNPEDLRPVSAGIRILHAIAEHAGSALQETHRTPTPGEADVTPLEKLFGRTNAFTEITGGEWNDRARFLVPAWAAAVTPDLLYG